MRIKQLAFFSLIQILLLFCFTNSQDSTKTDSRFLTFLKGTSSSPYNLSWGLDVSMAATSLSLQLLSNAYNPHYTTYTTQDLAQYSKYDRTDHWKAYWVETTNYYDR